MRANTNRPGRGERAAEDGSDPGTAKVQLGSAIQSARHGSRLSLDDLARESGVSSAMISLIERGVGNPSYVTLMKLAAALSLKPESLFPAPGGAALGTAAAGTANPPGRAAREAVNGGGAVKLVPAAASTINILKYLSEQDQPVGVTQIARELGLNVSTCFNILRTLVAARMIYFDAGGKTYSLGLGVVDLATGVFRNRGILGALQPHLRRLAQEYGVTASLWRRTRDDRLVLVTASQGDDPLRIHLTVGQRMPLYIGSAGRCMAAHSGMSRQQLREAFAQLRWDGPITFEQYQAEVIAARESGYAIDDGVLQAPILTVGCALLDPDGMPAMALSAAMFRERASGDVALRIAAELTELAGSITRAARAGVVDMRTVVDLEVV